MEDVIDQEGIIAAISEQGDTFTDTFLAVMYDVDLDLTKAVDSYLAQVRRGLVEVDIAGAKAVGYESDPTGPASVYHTTMLVSNLLDLGCIGLDLLVDLLTWLLSQQHEKGYWDNPGLHGIGPPGWDNPENLAVHIIWTSMVSNVLSRLLEAYHGTNETYTSSPRCHNVVQQLGFPRLQTTIETAVQWLETVKNSNGALFGMPQASWLYSPALAYEFGIDSSRFLQHWTILDSYVPSSPDSSIDDISDVVTISRNLLLAGVNPLDPLLQRSCDLLIRTSRDRYPPGWSVSGSYNPRTSLAALQVLQATE